MGRERFSRLKRKKECASASTQAVVPFSGPTSCAGWHPPLSQTPRDGSRAPKVPPSWLPSWGWSPRLPVPGWFKATPAPCVLPRGLAVWNAPLRRRSSDINGPRWVCPATPLCPQQAPVTATVCPKWGAGTGPQVGQRTSAAASSYWEPSWALTGQRPLGWSRQRGGRAGRSHGQASAMCAPCQGHQHPRSSVSQPV